MAHETVIDAQSAVAGMKIKISSRWFDVTAVSAQSFAGNGTLNFFVTIVIEDKNGAIDFLRIHKYTKITTA